jgi:hypothetical protein
MKATITTKENAKGSWHELGTTSKQTRYIVVRLSDKANTTYDAEIDLGIGKAGGEEIVQEGLYLNALPGWVKEFKFDFGLVPARTRFWARGKASKPAIKIEVELLPQ